MHIPACATTELEILTFDDACQHSPLSETYDRDRWLYIPDFYSEYRYVLGTRGSGRSSASASTPPPPRRARWTIR